MPMYNLIEYSDNYSDTSGSLWQYKRDEIINNADVTMIIMLFHLNIKQNLLVILLQMEQIEKIAVPLKYLSNLDH